MGERIKFFESIKDTKKDKKPTTKTFFKKYKVEDRKKFYDSITVTTNEKLPNKQKINIIKNYKVEDRKKFYESLKNLTNKKIIKTIKEPRKKPNNKKQNKTEKVENKDEKIKLRPPTNFKFIPFESEPEEIIGQNNIVINADLNNDISQIIMDRIRPEIKMRTKVVYGFKSRIHRGKGEIVEYYKTLPGKLLRGALKTLTEIEDYIEKCEIKRLDLLDEEVWGSAYLPATEVVKNPGVYQGKVLFIEVNVKLIHTNETLMGCGPLPDWLRKKKSIHALDTYDNKMCFWNTLAVFNNYSKEKNRPAERIKQLSLELAQEFYKKPNLKEEDIKGTDLVELEDISNFFKINIRMFEPKEDQETWVLVYGKGKIKKQLPTLDAGLHKDHCFFIKDLPLLTNSWECNGCEQRFNRHDNYNRHLNDNTCTGGKTQVICMGKKCVPEMSWSEKIFYGGNTQFSYVGCMWIEKQSELIDKHIHHALCGHGGERCVRHDEKELFLVDGYEPTTNTVYEYYGCKWHECPCSSNETIKYNETLRKEKVIKDLGYNLVSVWECEKPDLKYVNFKKKFFHYPYFIVWDSEAMQTKQNEKVTEDLTFINKHIPISIAISDNLSKKATCVVNNNPEELIKDFVKDLDRRQKDIVKKVQEDYTLPDEDSIPKNVKEMYKVWCNQVPVLGFNSGKYDINMIKKHFVNSFTDLEDTLNVAKKENKYMYLKTPRFNFLDMINYLAPGVSFDNWCKANNCEQQKLFFPYQFLDSYDKLSHIGPVKYEDFYSDLKKKIAISHQEYEEYKNEMKKRGCITLKDWLIEYNKGDVIPFIEAVEKTREKYSCDDIDMLKDAVSIPGISMRYVLNKAIKNSKGKYTLYAPGDPCYCKCDVNCKKPKSGKNKCEKCFTIRKECTVCKKNKAYDLLKTGMVGGQAQVFVRWAEVNKSFIRSNKYKNPKICKIIQGYDANSLYLYVSGLEMPCGKERYYEVKNPTDIEYIKNFCNNILTDKLFGFCQVDIHTPDNLFEKFEELPPLYVVDIVPENLIPDHMKEYQKATGRKTIKGSLKLLSVTRSDKILLYTPLIKWYLNHGLIITAVHKIIEYKPSKPFKFFPIEVSNARRDGDI